MPADDRAFLRYGHLGITFVLVVAASSFVGLKVDAWWGTAPLFSMLGLVAGFAAGLYYLVATLFPPTSPGRPAAGPPGPPPSSPGGTEAGPPAR